MIVSSGFRELIEPVLERESLGNVELLSNTVDPDPGGWRVRFRVSETCEGLRAASKRSTAAALADGTELADVGDGYSDRCAAELADLVFARRGLARYLEEQGVPFEHLTTSTPSSPSRFRAVRLRAVDRAPSRVRPDPANLWHEEGLYRVLDGREVRIEPASGGVRIAPGSTALAGLVRRYLGEPFDLDAFAASRRPNRSGPGSSRRCAASGLRSSRTRSRRWSPPSQLADSLRAAFSIRNRLIRTFGERHDIAYAFPTRERLARAAPEKIVAVGFSRRKAEYVVGLGAPSSISTRSPSSRTRTSEQLSSHCRESASGPRIGSSRVTSAVRRPGRPATRASKGGASLLRRGSGRAGRRCAFSRFANLAAHYLLVGHRVYG